MGNVTNHGGHAHPNPNAHGHHDEHGASHGSLREYVVGFLLSVVLTAIPFWLVMTGAIPDKQATALVIMAFAAVQIVVHMIYFLHMNTKSENGWTVMALIFTIVIVIITLSGSLWVMYHLNTNMMPMSAHEMGQLP
ncbi:cytochrome o ubiquinol oxidase subunit IV [Novosphingobium kaempferiae]|uniref:cytochrome o ubiquinol oxidase subunit IV n=1 Tax=Novosphingobium kaempferiae TaxID=2896849 RepID=UPI001E5A74E4|nr:cytochrome o ubiquinol oxidase subunit IV [Novosphingobium kaempferiae]